MTAPIISMPCIHEGYYLARITLRCADATPEQVSAALDVLRHSPDWMDMQLCRDMRWAKTRKLMPAELSECILPAASPGLIREAVKLAIIVGFVVAFYVVTP